MPAQNIQRVSGSGIYCHVYNKGIENRIIFADDSDYSVFISYLEEYLNPPKPLEDTKKDFTINGRSFKGIPHQPKNYFEKVELLAYSLKPDHFHLVLFQKTEKSLQAFLRSLLTRYSMYFNKKYKRSGTLFTGPYKSLEMVHQSGMLLLIHYLHNEGGHSTHPEYLGIRQTTWVKTKTLLSANLQGGDYKNFVEKYKLNQDEKEHLGHILLEPTASHLERTVVPESAPEEIQIKRSYRIPELIGASALFMVLLSFGLRNVTAVAQIPETASTLATLGTNTLASPTPTPEPQPTPTSTPTATPEPKITVTIKSEEGPVNIREKPTIYSKKIGEALDGDTFEFVSESPEWVEIKLGDDSTGFIFSKYIR